MGPRQVNEFVPDMVPIECHVSYADDQAVLAVRGELDLSTAPVMLEEVRSTLTVPLGGIAVDFGGVTFMDSSGVHALLVIRAEADDHHRAFALVSASPPVCLVLKVAGLAALFELPVDAPRQKPDAR